MPLAAATLRFVGEGVGVGVGDGVGLGEGVGLGDGDGDGVGLGVPPLNVTVSSALLPAVPWQGFVVPEQVVGLKVLALQPANVDPPLAVARNVIVAALSEVVIFGAHVLNTV